jgi:hypothetical protein
MGQPAREREAHHSADDEGREFIVAAFSAAKALGFSRPHCRIVHLIAGCFNKVLGGRKRPDAGRFIKLAPARG